MLRIGDKVRIKNQYTKDNKPNLWTGSMLDFQGLKVTIAKIEYNLFWGTIFAVYINGSVFWFLEKDLTPTEEELE